MAAVLIAALGAEGGDLVNFVVGEDDAHGAVLFSGVYLIVGGEDLLDPVRGGGGAKVIVVGG